MYIIAVKYMKYFSSLKFTTLFRAFKPNFDDIVFFRFLFLPFCLNFHLYFFVVHVFIILIHHCCQIFHSLTNFAIYFVLWLSYSDFYSFHIVLISYPNVQSIPTMTLAKSSFVKAINIFKKKWTSYPRRLKSLILERVYLHIIYCIFLVYNIQTGTNDLDFTKYITFENG